MSSKVMSPASQEASVQGKSGAALSRHRSALEGTPKKLFPKSQPTETNCQRFFHRKRIGSAPPYRGTSLIRNTHPRRITIGP